MVCPRCGASTETGPECPRCGVVLAKARPPRQRPADPAATPPPPPGEASMRGVVFPLLALAALVVVTVLYVRQELKGDVRPARTAGALRQATAQQPPPTNASDEPPAVRLAVPVPDARPLDSDADAGDVREATRLANALRGAATLSAEDLRSAERLQARYPAAGTLRRAVLLTAAAQERAARRFTAATELVDRAVALAPDDPETRRARLALAVDRTDWAAAEAAAREVLALAPADGAATRALGYALLRLDRSREAIETLSAYLDGHEDREAAALLGRLRHDSAPEAALSNQILSHFHVRYDGEAHEDVGREVLRVCERHYATLVRSFDHQPSEPIPVVLLSVKSYYEEVGAPAWSSGVYTPFDGRVRIPIGGLTTTLSPQLDGTVLHELTHAFVNDRSRGLAPRELHEGLAQLMAGHHLAAEMGDQGLAALADGRIPDPHGFYLLSLGWVEDLLGQRGQGGVNDVLAAMARTGNVDEAFREVYGRDLNASKAEWLARLRQQHGS